MIQIAMEMPDKCSECRFQSEHNYCSAMEDNFCGYTVDDGKPDWCPLIDANPRVLTLDEVKFVFDKQEPVWLEVKDVPESNYLCVGYRLIRMTRKGRELAFGFIGSPITPVKSYGVSMYNKNWRCWNKEPTQDQMLEASWNG